MGERVGTSVSHCSVAEDIMEYAGHKNAAAGVRSFRLSPRWAQKRKFREDADDPFVKVYRLAATSADLLLRSCVQCDLSLIASGPAVLACPVQTQFEDLKTDIQAQLDALHALRGEQ